MSGDGESLEPQAMSELEELAGLIEKSTGIVVPRGQYPHLGQVAREHARTAGFPQLKLYLEVLEKSFMAPEWRRLLSDVTIKESFLFRVPEQFDALAGEILPPLVRSRGAAHRFRVWSAGCARGEEPATLAMVMAQSPLLLDRDWGILATDVDETALAAARRGEHDKRAVAHVPAHLRHVYLERRGDRHVLAPELLERIEFRPFNFFQSPYLSLGPAFDVIFLRNVLIYFSPESQRRVISRVISRLAPDGHLFLGHSETLWKLNDELEPVEFGNCFAYRRPVDATPSQPRRRRPAKARPRPAKARPARTPEPASPPAPAPPPIEPAVPIPPPQQQLTLALQALAGDRISEARELVERCVESHPRDASAHAFHGMIQDLEGEAEAAISAYRAALFLEPSLFQIRFLLAHRFEHLGWTARARSEYRRVLTELENGHSRELEVELPRLLPSREEARRRCRRALGRI